MTAIAPAAGTCSPATGLVVQLQPSPAFLKTAWIPGGGACLSLFINGVMWTDVNTGYGLFAMSVNGIDADCNRIKGGLSAGEQVPVFVRNYDNGDTTGAVANHLYCDTPVDICVIDPTFVGCNGGTGGNPPPQKPCTGTCPKHYKFNPSTCKCDPVH